jgi:hypothetical protein
MFSRLRALPEHGQSRLAREALKFKAYKPGSKYWLTFSALAFAIPAATNLHALFQSRKQRLRGL